RGRPAAPGILSDLEAFSDCGNGPAHTSAARAPLLSQRPLPLPLLHSQDRYRTLAGVARGGSLDRSAPFEQASLAETNLAGERPGAALVFFRNRRGDGPRSAPLLACLSWQAPVQLAGALAAPSGRVQMAALSASQRQEECLNHEVWEHGYRLLLRECAAGPRRLRNIYRRPGAPAGSGRTRGASLCLPVGRRRPAGLAPLPSPAP